jgi:hypothetical protein
MGRCLHTLQVGLIYVEYMIKMEDKLFTHCNLQRITHTYVVLYLGDQKLDIPCIKRDENL